MGRNQWMTLNTKISIEINHSTIRFNILTPSKLKKIMKINFHNLFQYTKELFKNNRHLLVLKVIHKFYMNFSFKSHNSPTILIALSCFKHILMK